MTILGKMPMCQPLNTRVPEDITEKATSPDAAGGGDYYQAKIVFHICKFG
jgi:hypothetical protein